TTIDVGSDAAGAWHIQGIPVSTLTGSRMASADAAGPLAVSGEDIRINFRPPESEQPVRITVQKVEFKRDEMQHGFEASLMLPQSLGHRVAVAASQRLAGTSPRAPWQVFVEGQSINVAGIAQLVPAGSLPEIG